MCTIDWQDGCWDHASRMHAYVQMGKILVKKVTEVYISKRRSMLSLIFSGLTYSVGTNRNTRVKYLSNSFSSSLNIPLTFKQTKFVFKEKCDNIRSV